jgi:Txe/YoeB family toxin of toxin-antitoxin system
MDAGEAREKLCRLLDETASDHQPCRSPDRARTPFWSAKKTGIRFGKLCFFFPCPACASPSLKGLPRRLTDVRKNRPAMPWEIVFTRQARKDSPSSCRAGLRPKAEQLLSVLAADPFGRPPPFEKLVGYLRGACSRRINIQHRLACQVVEDERTVKVLRMWYIQRALPIRSLAADLLCPGAGGRFGRQESRRLPDEQDFEQTSGHPAPIRLAAW